MLYQMVMLLITLGDPGPPNQLLIGRKKSREYLIKYIALPASLPSGLNKSTVVTLPDSNKYDTCILYNCLEWYK